MRYHLYKGVDIINGTTFEDPISDKYLGYVYEKEKAVKLFEKECHDCIVRAKKYPKRNYFTYIVAEEDGFLESVDPNVKIPRSYTLFYKNYTLNDKSYLVEIKDGKRLNWNEIDNSWQ